MSHKILSLKKKFIYYKIKIYHMAGGYLCLEADVEIFMKCYKRIQHLKMQRLYKRKEENDFSHGYLTVAVGGENHSHK